YLRSLGADAEKVATPGNPVVIGKFVTGRDRPIVTIYNHLDVQPANEPQWLRAPFVFYKDAGRYIGRGSTDDKGPALTALFGARYAIERRTPVNIQFIWELEEEIGSPNFEHFMKQKAGNLATDSTSNIRIMSNILQSCYRWYVESSVFAHPGKFLPMGRWNSRFIIVGVRQ